MKMKENILSVFKVEVEANHYHSEYPSLNQYLLELLRTRRDDFKEKMITIKVNN